MFITTKKFIYNVYVESYYIYVHATKPKCTLVT